MDPHLAARAQHAAGEQGRAGGHEAAVTDPRPVEVGVRPDQDVVAHDQGMPGAAAQYGVLHHHAVRADLDPTVLGGERRPEQDPGVRPDPDRAAQDGGGGDIGGGMDVRDRAAVLDQHAPTLPAP